MSLLKRSFGLILVVALALCLPLGAQAAKAPAPSPSPSASPAPLPTATPEPPDIAIPRLEAKVKADPNDRQSAVELAGYYLNVGRPDRSVPLTQKLLTSGFKTTQVYFIDGVGQESLGHIPQAVADFEQASILDPTNAQVLLRLTDLYLRENRSADAERVAKRALTFNKDDENALINLGLVFAQESKFEEARTQFEAAAKLNPKDATPIVREGQSYVDQKAYDYAVQTFDRALAVDPKNVDALTLKAEVLAGNLNRVNDAIAVYDRLLGIVTDENDKVVVLNREAQTYARAKQSKEAEGAIQKMIAAYPKNVTAHLNAGDYWASTNQLPKAEAEWKAALGIDSKAAPALARLGNLYLGTAQNNTSIDYFKRIADQDPQNAEALFALGRAYSFGRQYTRARDACGRSFDAQRTPQALACVGASDFEVKNYKEASKIFNTLDKNGGKFLEQNPQFIFMAGQSYEKNGQKPQAKVMYKRFLAFVKPNSTAAAQVKKLIADIDKPAPKSAKPAPTAKPKKK